jgi:molybdopterin molybdotransferase
MSLVPVADAIASILSITHAVERIEVVPIAEASGRVLAHDPAAAWDLPGADVSIMDGWAVRTDDIVRAIAAGPPVVLRVAGESAAGHPQRDALGPGEAARISTGAVLPAGADAVVAQEDTERTGASLAIDAEVAAALDVGTFVRPRGAEVARGERLLPTGHRLTPPELGLLAAAGAFEVAVYARPRVAILSTGDELVPIGATPRPGQVVSSNGVMLAALVADAGGEPQLLPDTRDAPAALAAVVRQGVRADMLVTCGGISVGDHDHMLDVLRGLGAEIHVRGIALRPGKPTTVASCAQTPCLLLPGNPASAWVAFELLGRPALLRRAGVADPVVRAHGRVRLAGPARGSGRRAHYVRARWVEPGVAMPLPVQQSGNLRSVSEVDLLLVVEPGVDEVPTGSMIEAMILRPAATSGA